MFLKWVISILLNAVALVVAAQLLDGFIIESFGWAILASVVLGLFNTIVKPILIMFTLPITFISLGLFLFVINATTLWFTQMVIKEEFVIDHFGTAVLAAVIISVLNLILNKLVKDAK
ncbi:phage holin family protein [Lentibacillus saliphilus]|uniref:phage holin family protein n=1 Tax=Lentibacillus saliphilus TaxID=2737028 RepID=UPI001C2F20FD|nr:phage holin family protein [Lentibacillus saliphilus]